MFAECRRKNLHGYRAHGSRRSRAIKLPFLRVLLGLTTSQLRYLINTRSNKEM